MIVEQHFTMNIADLDWRFPRNKPGIYPGLAVRSGHHTRGCADIDLTNVIWHFKQIDEGFTTANAFEYLKQKGSRSLSADERGITLAVKIADPDGYNVI